MECGGRSWGFDEGRRCGLRLLVSKSLRFGNLLTDLEAHHFTAFLGSMPVNVHLLRHMFLSMLTRLGKSYETQV